VKAAPFDYHTPRTTREALEMLSHLEGARVLAGGQSLMPMLAMRYLVVDHLVDANCLESELGKVERSNGKFRIGAITRQRALERSAELEQACPIFREALDNVGHFQTRNRGTIGGSLCHLDPAAELPAVLSVYDGTELEIQSHRQSRTLSISEWAKGYMTPALVPGEMLTHITLTPWQEPHGYAFLELARRDGDFAIAGVACLVAVSDSGAITRAAISLCGVAVRHARLAAAERLLVGEMPTSKIFRDASAEVEKLQGVIEDAQNTVAYRRHVASALVRRGLEIAARRAAAASGSGRRFQ
jgi:carbon-monoxide dehydrogenase medium subunit